MEDSVLTLSPEFKSKFLYTDWMLKTDLLKTVFVTHKKDGLSLTGN